VSVASPSPATTAAPPPASETCPLCGAPLGLEQEWCLRCGAAARTRLAASPSWKAPVLALAVLAALSLGVLAAALVTLAGGSDRSTTAPVTTTITTAPTQTTAPTATTPTTVPGTRTPGTGLTGTSVLPRTTTSGTPGTTTPHAGLTGPSTTPRLKTPSTRAPGRTTPRATTPTSNPLFTPTLKR
jgi:hypothetical protein